MPPPRGWWSRNWKWVVPIGCLLPVLLCGGIVTLVLTLGLGMIKSSDPYQHAVTAAQSSPAVIAALGSPVKPGFLVSGSLHVDNSTGDADLAIPISGPRGTGKVYVTATRSGGVWTYSATVFKADKSPARVDLEPTSKP